ncbi:M15 family metallopeptidase [Mycobacterium sp. M26]|uniref:M15 family metallopeptidase n=1 Tax=Mycobacterium sp. M26 TaxID=1762962 RepID=UPI00073F5CCF|nr:M15 family metallopeptidase [Mycobacterium sp. M26]
MLIRAVFVGLASLAVTAAATTAPVQPRIMLVDNTVTVDPATVSPGDGSLGDGQVLTAFDVQNPAIGRLDPALLSAIQAATTAAAADGITMTITSGWRSPEFQERLLDDAVATYGSLDAARQWVQTPAGSKHVIGQAVDVGGVGADQWLIANGARFGLCRIYANELWHFELATDAAGNCPPLLRNAAG